MDNLQAYIKEILLGEIKDIIIAARQGNMQIIEEKENGDSATNADVAIGNLLSSKLKDLVPNSLVIEEESFTEALFSDMACYRHIWIIDPIDGTKAFRTKGNNEYCVAIALLENFSPVISMVYAPEYEFTGEKGLLFEADSNGATLNGKSINLNKTKSKHYCVNHIHRDTVLNEFEQKISKLCQKGETIRAYDGHSTLLQICLVAGSDGDRVFTRRGANIWDIVQGAYIVNQAGGKVTYDNGSPLFPLDPSILQIDGNNHLIMPQIVACNADFHHKLGYSS